MKKLGHVTVYWGSMFSGKTTALIDALMFAEEGAICFKPKVDNRDSEDIIKTHDGMEFPATTIEEASQILYLLEPTITTVGIEEASLFLDDPTLIPTIEVLRTMGYNVVITGLDMTAEGKPFGQMPNIAAISDSCFKYHTQCTECGDQASISHFMGGQKGVVEVGGADKYQPLCRTCWLAKKVF